MHWSSSWPDAVMHSCRSFEAEDGEERCLRGCHTRWEMVGERGPSLVWGLIYL